MQKSMGSTGGFALVIVLGFVVLVVSILVAFLLSTATERNASGGYASSVAARQLGDTAVSLVEAQINHATTYVPNVGDKIAWTSQPGLLRTFKQDGTLLNLYKLYSADSMITNDVVKIDPDNTTNPDYVTSDWAKNPALWVDLNAPAAAGVDPANSKESYVYPILDPRALNDNIDGVMPPLNNAGLTINANAPSVLGAPAVPFKSPSGGTETPAPMPVHWLYVLRNGKVVAPTVGAAARSVIWNGETAANPVVGRIAFWADDDTSKVNINTASEGSFWDTPRGYSATEYNGFASKQPARNEFQRYPGHPATVSLSAIFPSLTAEQIYSLVPRITGDDENYTINGTKGWTSLGGTQLPKTVTSPTSTTQGIRSDGERLYTSIDEMMFKAKRTAGTPEVRTTSNALTRNVLESRRFFLTAHGRAPETNLFNLPRIAMWPVYALDGTSQPDPLRTTTFDRIIAMCASTGAMTNGSGKTKYTLPYFFQRQSALDPTHDLSNSPAPAGIPRNAQLYTYLQDLTSSAIPGFGPDTFLAKYGDDRNQILTEIFDYVRCTNLYDDLLDYDSSGNALPSGHAQYAFTANIGGATGTAGHGLVAPIQGPDNTQGQGRYHTLRQLTAIFINCAEKNATIVGNTSSDTTAGKNVMLNEPFPGGSPLTLNDKQVRVQVMILPDFYSTMVGWRPIRPSMKIRIKGLDGLTLNDIPLHLPKEGYITQTIDPNAIGGGNGSAASLPSIYAPMNKLTNRSSFDINNSNPIPSDGLNYPFISAPVTVEDKTVVMTLKCSGNIEVSIYAPSDADMLTAVPFQKLTLKFPTLPANMPVPVPKLAMTTGTSPTMDVNKLSFFSDGAGTIASYGRLYLNGTRTTPQVKNFGDLIVKDKDALRSLLPTNATSGKDFRMDYRLLASIHDVPAEAFGLHPAAVAAPSTAMSGMLTTSTDGGNIFVTGAKEKALDIPSAMPAPRAADKTGDFDRGTGARGTGEGNGAGANKPDEGDILGLDDNSAVPYYEKSNNQQTSGPTYFSPNRIIPSPVMFGSLPSGVKAVPPAPWQTLLFRPLNRLEAPVGTQRGHIGAISPPDYLLLDLFWMPVVEPYPISDRFSTAGKINLNYKIYPFGYIDRTTALRAALKAEMMTLVPTTDSKVNPGPTSPTPVLESFGTDPLTNSASTDYRCRIDADRMIKQFDERRLNDPMRKAAGKNVFISPSEICDMYMVPRTVPVSNATTAGGTTAVYPASKTWSNMKDDLADNYLQTADNQREKIYATVYQKLTTKSNTYTVHFRAQSLKRIPGSKAGTWTDGKDPVLGEYRGSTTIERFIDPAATIPDYAATASTRSDTLDHYYKWRVVQNTQFAP